MPGLCSNSDSDSDSDNEAPSAARPPTRPTSPRAAEAASPLDGGGPARSGGRNVWWEDTSSHSPLESEGQFQHGARLHPVARAAVETARHRPPKFASHRRSRPASRAKLERAAYPTIPEAV
jgi:hypothetical protein